MRSLMVLFAMLGLMLGLPGAKAHAASAAGVDARAAHAAPIVQADYYWNHRRWHHRRWHHHRWHYYD